MSNADDFKSLPVEQMERIAELTARLEPLVTETWYEHMEDPLTLCKKRWQARTSFHNGAYCKVPLVKRKVVVSPKNKKPSPMSGPRGRST